MTAHRSFSRSIFRIKVGSVWMTFLFGVGLIKSVRYNSMGHQVFVADVAFLNGKKSLSTSVSFKCNASDLLQIRADGSLSSTVPPPRLNLASARFIARRGTS